MKSRILATALVVGTLATASFAYNPNCPNFGPRGMMQGQGMQQQGMQQRGMRQQGMMQGQKMMQRGMRRFGGMQMFSNLNLSKNQRYEMSILRDEMKLEIKKLRLNRGPNQMANFIGNNGFDKAAFTKYSNDKHQKMMKIRANHMEKVFKILTKEQIAQLQKNINN